MDPALHRDGRTRAQAGGGRRDYSFLKAAPGRPATPAPLAKTRSSSGWLLILFVGVVGSISTALWIGAARLPHPGLSVLSGRVLASLLLSMALTSLNLLVRWFRWYFLVRRFTRRLGTRDSLAVYLATLPAIATPFFVGELVRVLILRRQLGTRASQLAWVWLIERSMDAAILLAFFLLVARPPLGLAFLPLLTAATLLIFRLLLDDRRPRNVIAIGSATLVSTALAWLAPALALVATVQLCGHAIVFATGLKAFSAGTLFGGLSGLPLGVSVAGSTMIRELLAAGVSAEVSVVGVLVYRAGTSIFAVFLGIAAFLFWRRRLARIVRNQEGAHFDEIAHQYEAQIPKHVRERLLVKKTALIQQRLERARISGASRGLDVGCGQGWYLGALARAGYRMQGVDISAGQLRKATANLHSDVAATATMAAPPAVFQADAQTLPFPDQVFDFAYSINALHHLPSRAAQERAIQEVVRVLRPGGVFILHEINTLNLVFQLYVGYLFPLLKQIDEGTEQWLLPSALPAPAGTAWAAEVQYFTFLPDFVPHGLQRLLDGIERGLERSAVRRYSAHYQACLIKDGA